MNRTLVKVYFLMPRLRFSMLWVVYTKPGAADPNCIAVCALAEGTRLPTTGMVEHLSCNHTRFFFMNSNMMRSSWVSISCAIQHDSSGYVELVEIESIHHAKAVIYRYIEWYFQKCKHGSLGRMCPEQILFASDLNESIPIKIKTKISKTFILNCPSNRESKLIHE